MTQNRSEGNSVFDLYELYSALNDVSDNGFVIKRPHLNSKSRSSLTKKKSKPAVENLQKKKDCSFFRTQSIGDVTLFNNNFNHVDSIQESFKPTLSYEELVSVCLSNPKTQVDHFSETSSRENSLIMFLREGVSNLKIADDLEIKSKRFSKKNQEDFIKEVPYLHKRQNLSPDLPKLKTKLTKKNYGIFESKSIKSMKNNEVVERQIVKENADVKKSKKIKTQQKEFFITNKIVSVYSKKINTLIGAKKMEAPTNFTKEDAKLKTMELSDSDNTSNSNELSHKENDKGENYSSEDEGLSLYKNPQSDMGKEDNAIFAILNSIFENRKISDLQFRYLSSDAHFYLTEVLRKKFVFDPTFDSFALKKARRRNEEQFKFVIKKGFKRLFKEFKRANNGFVRGAKLLDEMEFYKHYFSKVSDDTKESLENFFLPGSKIQREYHKEEIKLDKTVSFPYIHKIFRSELFRQDFVRYLLNGFVDEYIQLRNEKLWKISSNFILKRKNKGNKLPWTSQELFEAQRNLINIILSLSG